MEISEKWERVAGRVPGLSGGKMMKNKRIQCSYCGRSEYFYKLMISELLDKGWRSYSVNQY